VTPLPKKAHWPPYYIYIQTAAIALFTWVMTRAFYSDDAYISLVYARNLLEGKGLIWSAGEPVEGYTNFLFVILTAALGWLGMDLVIASIVLNFAGYVLLVFALYQFTKRDYLARFAASEYAYAHSINSALCVSLAASSVIILAWCNGGLEAVFFTGIFTAGVCIILHWLAYGIAVRTAFSAGILFALAAMARPEGVFLFGISGLFLSACWILKPHREHITFWHLAALGLGFIALYAPYTLWRISYFGEWLPNTYYAKIYGVPESLLFFLGRFYLLQFFYLPPMLPIFAIGLIIYARKYWVIKRPLVLLMFLATAFAWHIMSSGGDHMPMLRFCVPLVPLLALMIYYCNQTLIPIKEKLFRDISGALIVLSALQLGLVDNDNIASISAPTGAFVAPYVREHWPEGSLIALNPADALPYLAPNYRYLDMLGLNNKHIARRPPPDEAIKTYLKGKAIGHQKGDGAYVLAQKPDYIIWGNSLGASKPNFLSDHELDALPEFHKNYERITVYVDLPADLQKLREAKNLPPNIVLNDKGQLRFIYFQKKK